MPLQNAEVISKNAVSAKAVGELHSRYDGIVAREIPRVKVFLSAQALPRQGFKPFFVCNFDFAAR